MKVCPGLAAAVLLGALTASTSQAQGVEEAAVQKVAENYVAAFNSHDAKRLASLFEADAVLIDESGSAMRGRAEIEQGYREVFADTGMKGARLTQRQGPVRLLRPDIALSDGNYEIAGVAGPDSKLLRPTKGVYASVFAKKEGRWFLVQLAAFIPPTTGSAQ